MVKSLIGTIIVLAVFGYVAIQVLSSALAPLLHLGVR